MKAKQVYLKLAEVKILIQCFWLGLRESVSVNLLRDALLVTDGTCSECLDGFVVIQVSTPNLCEHNRSGLAAEVRQCQLLNLLITSLYSGVRTRLGDAHKDRIMHRLRTDKDRTCSG